jgi:hypothetical protein
MKIRSSLRGGLPSFYSAKVLLPLIFLGKGCHTRPRRENSCRLYSSMDVVFVE